MTSKYKYIISIFLSLILSIPLSAQKKVSKKKTAKTVRTIDITEIQNLIKAYRFEEAEDLITEELDKQENTDKSNINLIKVLHQARLGAEMLCNTEKVIIIDSTVVKRSDFLKYFNISRECGKIIPPSAIIQSLAGKQTGATAYMNELGDRCIYSLPDSTGALKLMSADRLGEDWSSPVRLEGIGIPTDIQDYPFMMADGMTLYFAAKGEESLGGYDIFVTRYNKSTGEFVRAENVGMPFNSPANDYLMAIDETCNIGWFVTDRNQTADNVCIYHFIPNETREVYDFSPENEEKIRHMAQLFSISETQTNSQAVKNALERISQIKNIPDNHPQEEHHFIINDQKVYTNLSQFTNPKAKEHAIKLIIWYGQQNSKNNSLEIMRSTFSKRPTEQLKNDILKLEKEIATLRQDIEKEENHMRQAETEGKQ